MLGGPVHSIKIGYINVYQPPTMDLSTLKTIKDADQTGSDLPVYIITSEQDLNAISPYLLEFAKAKILLHIPSQAVKAMRRYMPKEAVAAKLRHIWAHNNKLGFNWNNQMKKFEPITVLNFAQGAYYNNRAEWGIPDRNFMSPAESAKALKALWEDKSYDDVWK